jgi:hypothetical protein
MQPQPLPPIKIGGLEIRYLLDGTATGAGMTVNPRGCPKDRG